MGQAAIPGDGTLPDLAKQEVAVWELDRGPLDSKRKVQKTRCATL